MDSSRKDHQTMEPQSVRQRTPTASSEISQAPSATSHLNEKTGVYDHSSELESQAARPFEDASSLPKAQSHDPEPDYPPERFSQKVSRVRRSTWWFVGALLLAIPLSIFATVLSTIHLSGVRVLGFIIWLEILWTAGWIIHLSVWLVGKAWERLCGCGLDDWDDLFLDTATSQLGFCLALVAWGSSSIMCSFSNGTCNVHWLHMLRKVLLATIPATGIFLVKDFLLEVIIIRQASRMYDLKKDVVLRHLTAFNLIMGILTELMVEQTCFKKVQVWFEELKSPWSPGNGGSLLRGRSLAVNDYDASFERYVDGKGEDDDYDVDNKTFIERLRDRCRINYRRILEDQDGKIKEDVNEEFFKEKLEIPHVKKMNSSPNKGGISLTAKDMLKIFDKDGDDEIKLEEWVEANVETIMALRDINKSVRGIKRAAKSVDVVVSCLLLCVVTILYAAFFTNHLGSYLTPIWTTVTGPSFALAGTVTEFIAACSFVFSKQPYDIGDRVVIEDKDLIVDQICLLYTIFHRASDGATEQIAHKKICDSWITNLSRSRGLSVKESATVPESTDSITRPTLNKYHATLKDFIKSDSVRSRYLDVDNLHVSLQSSKDEVKQVVVVVKLRDLIVRREDILAGARNEVREKLEELVRTSLLVS